MGQLVKEAMRQHRSLTWTKNGLGEKYFGLCFLVASLGNKKCLFSLPLKLWEAVMDYRQWLKCLGRTGHETLSFEINQVRILNYDYGEK